MSTEQPAISIVINSLDRATSLGRTLRSLYTLRYCNFEVVVVQGPCSDETPEVLARHAENIRVGYCAEANLSMSRNIGIAMAKGEIVAFLDDDAVPEPDWLDRLMEGMQTSRIGAVGGFIRDRGGVEFQYRTIVADRFGDARETDLPAPPIDPGQFISPTGTNIALRRDALIAIGGFDEEYAYFLDETDVNLRLFDAGWQLAMAPEAEVHHGFLENRVRGSDRAPRSTYLIARSKAYFCHANAARHHTAREIEAALAVFRKRQRKKLINALFMRRIGPVTLMRLAAEIARGLKDGARDAQDPAGRRLLPATLLERHASDRFHPFRTEQPAPRLKVCFSSPAPYETEAGDGPDRACQQVARALAALGHEVTLICSGDGLPNRVSFVEGLWLHEISGRDAAGWTRAVGDEIVRTAARRAYDIVCIAADDPSPGMDGLGMPLVTASDADILENGGLRNAFVERLRVVADR